VGAIRFDAHRHELTVLNLFAAWGLRHLCYFDEYENARGLGNTQPGDGFRSRGRRYVQITGRNYSRLGRALGLAARLIDEPDSALDP
jgi:predicted chitinase